MFHYHSILIAVLYMLSYSKYTLLKVKQGTMTSPNRWTFIFCQVQPFGLQYLEFAFLSASQSTRRLIPAIDFLGKNKLFSHFQQGSTTQNISAVSHMSICTSAIWEMNIGWEQTSWLVILKREVRVHAVTPARCFFMLRCITRPSHSTDGRQVSAARTLIRMGCAERGAWRKYQ